MTEIDMTEIREFRIDIPQADLDDLAERLARIRWTDELPDAGNDYGVPLQYVRAGCSWRTGTTGGRGRRNSTPTPSTPPPSTGRTCTSCTIVSWNVYDTGSHFAAHDAPGLLVDDIRGFFRQLR